MEKPKTIYFIIFITSVHFTKSKVDGYTHSSSSNILWKEIEDTNTDFADLVLDILLNTLLPFKCVALITDIVYEDVLNAALFKKFGIYLSFFVVGTYRQKSFFISRNFKNIL